MIASIIGFLIPSGGEVVLIVIVILILFGPKQLPEIARMAGKMIREFRNAMDGVKQEITQTMNEVTPPITKPEDILKEDIKEEKKDEVPKKDS
jgi:TatA/E family protein of Tat protein translocase